MITIIMVLIVVIAAIIMIKKERKPSEKESEVDAMYSIMHTPDEIFKALGAEIKKKDEKSIMDDCLLLDSTIGIGTSTQVG